MQFCLVNGGCVDLTGVGKKKKEIAIQKKHKKKEKTLVHLFIRQIPSPLKRFAFREEVNKLPNAPLPRL